MAGDEGLEPSMHTNYYLNGEAPRARTRIPWFGAKDVTVLRTTVTFVTISVCGLEYVFILSYDLDRGSSTLYGRFHFPRRWQLSVHRYYPLH